MTGAAGFIGFHTANRLAELGYSIVGIDNLNAYYSPQLKKDRLNLLEGHSNFRFELLDVADTSGIATLFEKEQFDYVVHLAAQAGVRHSLKEPHSYIQSNLVGFGNILEGVRNHGVNHLVYASSSSIYGLGTKMPFSTHGDANHPVSLYAATKRANELMAHSYSHLYRMPTTGLRFFTVYGPWGRPDMAPMLFASAISEGRPIQVFNQGKMSRDFTYVDDVVDGVIRTMQRPASPSADWDGDSPDPATSSAPFRIYNIGNHEPIQLLRFIELMEFALGRKAQKEFLEMQPGDVVATYADVDDLMRDTGFKPSTSIEVGMGKFIEWYRSYYG